MSVSPARHAQRQLRRAIVAGTIGATIEWYDFLLYGQMTGLVFGKLFFPKSEPLVGVFEAFAVYAVGFVARPIGGALFGHFGDRIGRRASLVTTLVLTGLSTCAIGLVPTYARIGASSALLLTMIRFIQGLALGGEWGGSVLLPMEWAGSNAHRGFITSWAQFGAPAGALLANLAVLGFSALTGSEFLAWGWRVPFLLSGVLVAVGLYLRLRVDETPTFTRLSAEGQVARAPALEVLRKEPRLILLTALARTAEQAPAYVYSAFVFTYAATVGASHHLVLMGLVAASSLQFILVPLSGHLSDCVGRRRMYLVGTVATGLYGYVYFALLGTRSPTAIFLGVLFSQVPHALMYGPQAALVAECFPPRLRYSGASIGFQLASIFAGGPAPLVATALLARFHTGYAIALYIFACAVVSVGATLRLPDYTNRDIGHASDGGATPIPRV